MANIKEIHHNLEGPSRSLLLKIIVMLLMCFRLPLTAMAADSQKVGLVLSGGGAKGIAHVGVIRALEEHNIPIDCITGTSMGAIIGSLYAIGYTPEQMMQLIESKEFLSAAMGEFPPGGRYLFMEPEKTPSMINLSAGSPKDFHLQSVLPASIINPVPMNFAFMQIYGPYTAQSGGNFDNLFVPFRCVASDITHKRKMVLGSGELDRAVRASMSFPIVFHPIVLDDCLAYDGGIYDNFPVDVMRDDFHPDILIGVDVHSTDTINGFPNILDQIDMLVTQKNNYDVPADEGIKLRIDLNEFSLLDFAKAREIERIGYERAIAMIDSIGLRVTARRDASVVEKRRESFRIATPHLRFDSVAVSGGSSAENEYIAHIFNSQSSAPFSIEDACNAYQQIVSSGRITDLEPQAQFDPATSLYTLRLKATVKDEISFGAGGYITSSANSMLFLSANYNSLTFRTLDASLGAWIGQSYMAASLNARLLLRSRALSSAGLEAVVSRQKFNESEKLFFQDDGPAFVTNVENFANLYYSIATGRHSLLKVSAGFGHLVDHFFTPYAFPSGPETSKDRTTRNLGLLALRWKLSTVDDEVVPTVGHSLEILGEGMLGNARYSLHGDDSHATVGTKRKSNWAQTEIRFKDFLPVGSRLSIGLESTLLASSQKLPDSYQAAIVDAPGFNPTPASYNSFNRNMRATSFVTAGLVPNLKITDRFMLRGAFHGFFPFRPIEQKLDNKAVYGRWFSTAEFYGELSAVARFPFGSLSVYGAYQTSPADRWDVGVSFGIFILAPRFLRL